MYVCFCSYICYSSVGRATVLGRWIVWSELQINKRQCEMERGLPHSFVHNQELSASDAFVLHQNPTLDALHKNKTSSIRSPELIGDSGVWQDQHESVVVDVVRFPSLPRLGSSCGLKQNKRQSEHPNVILGDWWQANTEAATWAKFDGPLKRAEICSSWCGQSALLLERISAGARKPISNIHFQAELIQQQSRSQIANTHRYADRQTRVWFFTCWPNVLNLL